MLHTIVGLIKVPLVRYVGLALVVILVSFLTIQSIENNAVEDFTREVQLEQIIDNEDTEKRIKNAVEEVDRTTPDADDALEWLLSRQSR